MKEFEAIFLDFDGVILESVEVKGWAFGKLFEDHPEYVDEIVAFHHANGGMSRFDKFRYIYKEILKKPLPEKRFEALCEQFSELVYNRILECDFVPGALEFLRKYHNILELFIISATPHEEINRIVRAKGLTKYFKSVFGSPTRKAHWTKQIIEQRKFDRNRVVFVGDAMSDYRAADENGIRFVGRISGGRDIFSAAEVYAKVRDLFELVQFLSERG